MAVDPAGARPVAESDRRARRMTSEATSRVPVVAHRPAATPKLRDEIALCMEDSPSATVIPGLLGGAKTPEVGRSTIEDAGSPAAPARFSTSRA
jgi:hypothetical protein